MRILVAMDKFKGSLTAAGACRAVVRGLIRVFPAAVTGECAIADGGEGTTDAVVAAGGGEMVSLETTDAQGRAITAEYGLVRQVQRGGVDVTAVMEMSATAGLVQVSDLPLNPKAAGTRGTGEMIRDALARGVSRIIIGIGGSATNDGGIGMAQALGFVFKDASGQPVENLPAEFERVETIESAPAPRCEVLVACDVRNPLLGDTGATRVYGPQKGVRDFDFFEARLKKLADLVKRDLGIDCRDQPGAGAAGGLGFGLMSFCGGKLVPGFELICSTIGLEAQIASSDLVITGEGKLDGQTLHGKGPVGVAEMARRAGKRVIGIAGVIEESKGLSCAFDLLLQTKPDGMSVAEAMEAGARLVEEKVVASAERIREAARNQPDKTKTMSKRVVLLFAGQGAQKAGMGRDLAEAFPCAKVLVGQADRVLGFPLSQIMFEGPIEELTKTSRCQPALFVHGLAVLAALRDRLPSLDIAACAGLSLGEFTAHAAAGTFDFETGLRLVHQRGTFMEEACEQTRGSMAAMIGGEESAVRELAAECDVDVANFNAPGQIVLSGSVDGIKAAVAGAKAKGIMKAVELAVAGAYHSRLMKSAQDKLAAVLQDTAIQVPRVPVVSNFEADVVTSDIVIRNTLERQVTGSVRWTESMKLLISQGHDLFLELGPGGVLAGLMKRIDKTVKIITIEDVPGLERAVAELQS